MRLPRLFFVSCALCAALIACGGGGGAGSRIVPGGGGAQSSGRPAVTLRMVIPSTTQITSARTKKPEYVSAAVASIVYQITASNGTAPLVSGANYTNVASPSPCAAGANGLVCTITISATLSGSGAYNVTIATYDAAQSAACTPGGTSCSGNLLGLATLPEAITVGSVTPVAVTLGGIPAFLMGVSLTGYGNGNGDGVNNGVTIFGPTPQTGVAEILDADGNVIIPPGAPTITASSSNTAALTVAMATPTPGQYALTWTAVKSGAYVQPGTYTVTLAMQVPGTALTYTYPLSVQIAHSALYIGTCSSGTAAVYGYFDGNTTGASPDLTISSALDCEANNAPGIATDRYGNLYVADGLQIFEYSAAPGTNPAPIATAGSAQGLAYPQSITLDGNDDVYVGDQTAGVVAFNSPGPSGFGSPAVILPVGLFEGYTPSVAADNAGDLYVAVQADGDFALYHLPSLQAGLSSGTVPVLLATLQPSAYNGGSAIAVDVQPSPSTPPNVWTGGQAPPSYIGTLWSWSPLGTLLNTQSSAALGGEVQGVAVDGNGVVYAAYDTSFSVVTLSPPGYAVGASPITPPAVSPGEISVAVAPAAGVVGNRTGGGSPSPISTPAASHRRP